jgi:putative ABC transport system ATP-binding protein
MKNSTAIEIEDVHISLGDGDARVHILRGVSLKVQRGEAIGIVGQSGSGKSTLLMLLAGLERPDSGKIAIDGQSLAGMSEDQLARFRGSRIGLVFQSFHLIPTMTALENVAIPLELSGVSNASVKALAELEAVGLRARASHYPAQLSGGEQQRVAIARALVTDPAIVVADEPTGNLDEKSGQSVISLLFNLRESRGTTLILVTHDMSLASRCDRTVRMGSGLIQLERESAADLAVSG